MEGASVERSGNVNRSPEVNQLRDDMRKLQDDVRGLGSSLSRITDSIRQRGTARAQEEMDKVSEELRQAYGTVRDKGYQAKDSIEKQIEDRPFLSVAVAFIVGIILGKIFSSRR